VVSAARRGVAFAAGLLFGLGLALSGMADPAKVLGFLDVFGRWDPRLAGVMAAAIPVAALIYRLTARAGRPMPPRPSQGLDRDLVAGALLFGIGWGLVGLCPGPALADVALAPRGLVFVAAMAAGLGLHRWLDASRRAT